MMYELLHWASVPLAVVYSFIVLNMVEPVHVFRIVQRGIELLPRGDDMLECPYCIGFWLTAFYALLVYVGLWVVPALFALTMVSVLIVDKIRS